MERLAGCAGRDDGGQLAKLATIMGKRISRRNTATKDRNAATGSGRKARPR